MVGGVFLRIVDVNYNDVADNIDLSHGTLSVGRGIKTEAAPIDNKIKFAWADDDYEDVQLFIPYTEEELAQMEAAQNVPNEEDTALDLLADHEYRLCMLELGGE